MQEQLRTLALSRTFILTADGLSEPQDQEGDTLLSTAALPPIIDGKYKILSQIGEGGMGTVYRAHHLHLDRDVALKTLRAGKVPQDAFDRFNREVQSVAKLDSRNVVRVFDFGLTQSNLPYYTMELLEGESLADRIERDGRLSIADAVSVFIGVANGLCAAHAKGIIHRDLKPANIFLELHNGKIQSAKVVDFGIAKLTHGSDGQAMTLGGAVFGSPLYMSPEQSQGEGTDKRSDIYSFGCSLFEALTGEPPYVGNNAFETILMHQTSRIPRLAKRDARQAFPAWLETLSASCMTKDKDLRVQSFQEVLDVFETHKNDLSLINQHVSARSEDDYAQEQDQYQNRNQYDQYDQEEEDPYQEHRDGHRSTRKRRLDMEQTSEFRELTRESDKQLKLLFALGLLVVGAGLTAVIFVIFPVEKVSAPGVTPPAATAPTSQNTSPAAQNTSPAADTAPASSGTASGTSSDTSNATSSDNSQPTTTTAVGTAATEKKESGLDLGAAINGLGTQDQLPAVPPTQIVVPQGIRRFKLRNNTITADNLATIGNSEIEDLDLRQCVLDNDAMGKLSKLHLQILRLGRSSLSDKGAAQLANCKNLVQLQVETTRVSDAGVIPLTAIKSLIWLDVRRTAITDHSMEAFAKMRQLGTLQLSGTKITESGLRLVCSSCKHLRRVDVAGCENISPDVVHYLRLEYPQIEFSEKEKTAGGFNDF